MFKFETEQPFRKCYSILDHIGTLGDFIENINKDFNLDDGA